MVCIMAENLKICKNLTFGIKLRYLYLGWPSKRMWPKSRKIDQNFSVGARNTLSDPILCSFRIFDQFLCLFHEFLSNF